MPEEPNQAEQTPETPNAEPTPETTATFTQADLDRVVAKALETREKNLKAEWENQLNAERERAQEEQLKAEHKYKELFERLEAKEKQAALRRETEQALKGADLLQIVDLFDGDLNSAEGRKGLITGLSGLITEQVKAQVARALKTDAPPTPATKGDGAPKRPDEMTPDEYAVYRRDVLKAR